MEALEVVAVSASGTIRSSRLRTTSALDPRGLACGVQPCCVRALSSTLRRIGGRTRIPQGATPARAGTLSRRAREQLLEAISSGLYPDDRLPPEAQLAIALGVSRTTLRAALQSLADDGILNRRRRHGTSINRGLPRNQLRLNRLISFSALIEQSGHVASVDLQQQRVMSAGTPYIELVETVFAAAHDR